MEQWGCAIANRKRYLGVHVMKKILISVMIALVLLFSSSAVDAKGKDKPQDRGQGKKVKKVEEKGKAEDAAQKAKDKEKAAEKAKARQGKPEKAKPADKGKAKDKTKAVIEDKGKAADKGKQKQLEALKKQLIHEEQKHLKRKARLERIRALAVKEGKTKTVERVDSLIEKEQGRYEPKLNTMKARERKILEGASDAEAAPAKLKGKAGEAKDKPKKSDAEDKADDEAEKAKEEAEKANGE